MFQMMTLPQFLGQKNQANNIFQVGHIYICNLRLFHYTVSNRLYIVE
jgi:hypothetical protein